MDWCLTWEQWCCSCCFLSFTRQLQCAEHFMSFFFWQHQSQFDLRMMDLFPSDFFFPLVTGQSQANCLSEAMLGSFVFFFQLMANRFTIYFLFLFLDQLNKQSTNIYLQPNARIKYIKTKRKSKANARKCKTYTVR